MHRWSFCEWIPILPRPVWPLAGQCGLGQNRVVGSMVCLLLWRCWAACQEGVCQDPIYIPTEPHHGLVESYRPSNILQYPPRDTQKPPFRGFSSALALSADWAVCASRDLSKNLTPWGHDRPRDDTFYLLAPIEDL